MIDALLAVVVEEIGEPDLLIPLGAEQQYIVGPDLIGPVLDAFELTSLSKCPNTPTFPLKP
jgi:hypothetical protein